MIKGPLLNESAQVSPRTSRTTNQRSVRSTFDAPVFGSIVRAKPKLYRSLPTRKGKLSHESRSTRSLRSRHDIRNVPTLGRRAARNTAPHHLRKPSLELFEMDQLVCNMLSVSVSADHGRNINSDLEEFGVIMNAL